MAISVLSPVEREKVASSPGFFRRHKLLFGLVVTIGVLFYAAFNVWVYRYVKSGKAPPPRQVWQTVTTSGAGFPSVISATPSVIPAGAGIQRNITPTPSPTPTPRPTGPGEFACDPYGVCNRYGDAARKEFCPVTFADSSCLDQCGEKEKQCKN